MSQFPVETSFPASYTDDYYDGYVKFLLFGATKTRLPRHIRLFNKCGDAYGFLLDNAYIADFEKGIEFMLTAVIYCNERCRFSMMINTITIRSGFLLWPIWVKPFLNTNWTGNGRYGRI